MPRKSGFDGTITITIAAGSISSNLESWSLNIIQDEWKQTCKNDTWDEFAFGGSEWTATVTFLVPTTVAAATHDLVGLSVTSLILDYDGAGDDVWTATDATEAARIIDQTPRSPMDGPVQSTILLRGQVAIAFTAAT